MAEENVEVMRTMLEPFSGINVADIDWAAEAIRETIEPEFTPDMELRTLASGLGSGVGEHYRGWDGFLRYLQEWLEPFSEYQIKNLEYIAAGDCVLVPSQQWGIGSGSGARVELELTTLYQLRDGRIARIHQYDTLEEAREAAASRTMSQANVEVIRRANAAFNAGDLEALEETCSPEIEWRDLQHAPDAPEVVHGIEAVRRIWSDWLDSFPDLRADVSEYVDAGDTVICVVHWHGSGKGSDAPFDLHTADVFELEDGMVARATFGYGSREKALEAVG
jgi:ketosteroid isomerase-like protein